MSDDTILPIIEGLRNDEERQHLRAAYQRDGYTQAVKDALIAALERQRRRPEDDSTVRRSARWAARTSGRLVGRAMRKLEADAEKLDRQQQKQ